MGFWSKLTIGILAILAFFYIKTTLFTNESFPEVEKKLVEEQVIQEPEETKPKKIVTEDKETAQELYVYFLGTDKNGSTVFKKVKREIPEKILDSKKVELAVNELINGPSKYEKSRGVYSEIPKSTKLLRVLEDKETIALDLSYDLVNGGGADSLYSRIKQIIKTILASGVKKPVYLYIDGKKADVIGGEGLMISQPLTENSLDE